MKKVPYILIILISLVLLGATIFLLTDGQDTLTFQGGFFDKNTSSHYLEKALSFLD